MGLFRAEDTLDSKEKLQDGTTGTAIHQSLRSLKDSCGVVLGTSKVTSSDGWQVKFGGWPGAGLNFETFGVYRLSLSARHPPMNPKPYTLFLSPNPKP